MQIESGGLFETDVPALRLEENGFTAYKNYKHAMASRSFAVRFFFALG